jgi:iron complex outermembrane receptor protein
LSLTIGSKFERNDHTGLEIQPAGRLMWTPTDRQTIWGSVARAVRTPTRIERDARANLSTVPEGVLGPLPVLVAVVGNPDLDPEELLAYEIGYRIEPRKNLSFDVAAFYNDYNLVANIPHPGFVEADPPPLHWLQDFSAADGVRGYTYGTELLVQWQPLDIWQLSAGYTWWKSEFRSRPYTEVTTPEHQVQLRSSLALTREWEFNAALYFVDGIRAIRQGSEERFPLDPYVRLDLGLTWRPSDHLEFSLWGQNLLDDQHREFSNYKSPRVVEIPRSVFGKVTWRF